MKLSELRKFFDELDDSINEEVDVVLDIDPRSNGEHLIDIGEIYRSRIDNTKIKIEPKIELYTENSLNNYIVERKNIFKRKELKCPVCGSEVAVGDRHCKICGSRLFFESANKKALKKDKHMKMENAKVMRQMNRSERRAMRIITEEKNENLSPFDKLKTIFKKKH